METLKGRKAQKNDLQAQKDDRIWSAPQYQAKLSIIISEEINIIPYKNKLKQLLSTNVVLQKKLHPRGYKEKIAQNI